MEKTEQTQVPVPDGYVVKKRLAAHNDKTLYLVEGTDGCLCVWKVFQKIYKYPLYVKLMDLEHTNLPRIRETVLMTNCFYVIEEYIDGNTLRDLIEADGALGKVKSLHIITQLCDVLSYLHNQPTPIIHRDITPANIMVNRDGTVKLLDFDIAREYKSDAAKDTEVVGTRPFAPPEQYGFTQSDPRSDIYSLGILLAYMLTDTYDPRRVTDTRLRRIILRCTIFTPEKRYRNVRQLKNRLVPQRIKQIAGYGAAVSVWVVVVVFIITYLHRRDLDSTNGPEPIVASITGGQNAYTLTPGGQTSIWVNLYDRNNQLLSSIQEPVVWTVEGLAAGDISSDTAVHNYHNIGLRIGPDTTERIIYVTATAASNPLIYHVFTVHVSTEMPSVLLSNPDYFRSGTPGRITVPFIVSNIPDGTHPAWVIMHFPSGIGLEAFYPEGFTFYSDVPLWMDGEITVTNGTGEVTFIFDGSITGTHTIGFHFGIDVPHHGTILDDNRIYIR
jgi:serine/threonine protein kinase